MVTKQNTKSLTPTDDNVGTDVIALFNKLNTKAALFTDSRNALIGREVLLADNKRGTGTRLAAAFGIDKGDVSRIASLAMGLSAAKRKALKSVVIGSIDVDKTDTLSELAKLGEAFRRTNKVATGTKGNTPKVAGETTKAEVGTVSVVTSEGTVQSPDLLAAVFDALMSGLIGLPELNAVIENFTAAKAAQDAEAAA